MIQKLFFILLIVLLSGCGSGEPFTHDLITVVIGQGERADDPQPLISGIVSLKTEDGAVLLGELPCHEASEGRWLLKETVTMKRPVSNGTEAILTLDGPSGPEEIEVEFSNSLMPDKVKAKIGGEAITIQCYVSVGDKWGLVIRPAE